MGGDAGTGWVILLQPHGLADGGVRAAGKRRGHAGDSIQLGKMHLGFRDHGAGPSPTANWPGTWPATAPRGPCWWYL